MDASPQTMNEAVDYVIGLMIGDEDSFQAGYTLKNAVIAVSEVYGFEQDELERWTLARLPYEKVKPPGWK